MSGKSSIILYNYFRSSASYRVRLALHLKGLEFEYRPVHLLKEGGFQKKAEFATVNPMKHVPALVVDGFTVSESVAIIKYLDHLKPQPRLFPADPRAEASVLQICEMINSGIQPLQNLKVLGELDRLGVSKDDQKEWVLKWVRGGFEALETLLARTAGEKHCFGDVWTAADCFLMPQVFAAARFGFTPDAYPTIARIHAALEKDPAVIAAHPMNQVDTEK